MPSSKGKILAGTGDWRRSQNDNVMGWVRPIEVEGEILGFDLTVKAYPLVRSLQFRIVLAYGKAIWRLDYANDDPHFLR
jgi:hypothetical protein